MSLNQGSLQKQIHAFRCTHSLICPTIGYPINLLPTTTQSFSCAPSSSPYASALYFLMDRFTTFSIFICISLCQRPLPCFKNSFNYFFSFCHTVTLFSLCICVQRSFFLMLHYQRCGSNELLQTWLFSFQEVEGILSC